MKPNDVPVYVNIKSNHPPSILKNIPAAVNKRLSKNSSNQKIFEESTPPFQDALNKAGYSYKMKFEPKPTNTNNDAIKRKRKRDVIWFNPPWSLNCKTRVAGKFLELVKTCFPRNHPLTRFLIEILSKCPTAVCQISAR